MDENNRENNNSLKDKILLIVRIPNLLFKEADRVLNLTPAGTLIRFTKDERVSQIKLELKGSSTIAAHYY